MTMHHDIEDTRESDILDNTWVDITARGAMLYDNGDGRWYDDIGEALAVMHEMEREAQFNPDALIEEAAYIDEMIEQERRARLFKRRLACDEVNVHGL